MERCCKKAIVSQTSHYFIFNGQRIVRDVRIHCRKRKHQEDCPFSLYIAFDVRVNGYVLRQATVEYSHDGKDGGELLTLELHKQFTKLKKVGTALFDLASTRLKASKRVLEVLQKEK